MKSKAARALLLGIFPPIAVFAHAAAPDLRQPEPPGAAELAYRWISIPIEVRGLSSECEFVPVRCSIDFSALLARLNVTGAVDERSLRLYRIEGRRREEIPYQFTSDEQPRARERRTRPGSSPNASYLGEYLAGETPPVPVTGSLTWIARGTPRRSERYLLRAGIPQRGRAIQVPFPPQNLRMFDDEGRAAGIRWFSSMKLHPQWPFEGSVQMFRDRQLLAAYHLGPLLSEGTNAAHRRPFFYPVLGPDGIALTEFGKPHDPTGSHRHHYSLWIAHANVNGLDFWSERGGVIAHEQLAEMEDGPVFARIVQKTRWRNGASELLRETRHLTTYHTPEAFRLMDVAIELTPAGTNAVTFGKTSFGFLAARVAPSMTVFDGGGEIRNASGDLNEQRAHLKRAAWIDQSGPIAPGRWGGIAILDHPENPQHPTGWHCRNDGWAGAAFNMEHPHTLHPGATLRLRYRIHLHRHNAIRGEVARRFQEFSAQPAVIVGEPEVQKTGSP